MRWIGIDSEGDGALQGRIHRTTKSHSWYIPHLRILLLLRNEIVVKEVQLSHKFSGYNDGHSREYPLHETSKFAINAPLIRVATNAGARRA